GAGVNIEGEQRAAVLDLLPVTAGIGENAALGHGLPTSFLRAPARRFGRSCNYEETVKPVRRTFGMIGLYHNLQGLRKIALPKCVNTMLYPADPRDPGGPDVSWLLPGLP